MNPILAAMQDGTTRQRIDKALSVSSNYRRHGRLLSITPSPEHLLRISVLAEKYRVCLDLVASIIWAHAVEKVWDDFGDELTDGFGEDIAAALGAGGAAYYRVESGALDDIRPACKDPAP